MHVNAYVYVMCLYFCANSVHGMLMCILIFNRGASLVLACAVRHRSSWRERFFSRAGGAQI